MFVIDVDVRSWHRFYAGLGEARLSPAEYSVNVVVAERWDYDTESVVADRWCVRVEHLDEDGGSAPVAILYGLFMPGLCAATDSDYGDFETLVGHIGGYLGVEFFTTCDGFECVTTSEAAVSDGRVFVEGAAPVRGRLVTDGVSPLDGRVTVEVGE